MSIKISTWNVNSIKARTKHVKRWLEVNQPDLLIVQELKGLEFPTDTFKEVGYESEAVTQKAYNGVAIFSKEKQDVVLNALPGDKSDEQARYLESNYKGLRVINIYMPNGNPVDTEKYTYKLDWMDRLYKRLKELRDQNITFVIGGDFNVIPADEDCHDPAAWRGDALFRPETHAKWNSFLHLGLYDAFRIVNQDIEQYSFWDYQAGAWPKNNGIRIDHFLLSPPLVDKLVNCTIDKAPRGEEKASDHTPVTLELNI